MHQFLQRLQGSVRDQLGRTLRPRRFLFQAAQSLGAEGAKGISDALVTAAQEGLDLAGRRAHAAVEQRLATPDYKAAG